MKYKKKVGLSPVIATMLLIALALVLAIIIFLWARNFIGEAVEKEGRAIELSCAEVSFRAERAGDKIDIENIGTVPIYGIEVRKKTGLSLEILGVETLEGTITVGQTSSVPLLNRGDITEGDELVIVPILLGETDRFKKSYVCDADFGETISA